MTSRRSDRKKPPKLLIIVIAAIILTFLIVPFLLALPAFILHHQSLEGLYGQSLDWLGWYKHLVEWIFSGMNNGRPPRYGPGVPPN